MVVIVKEKIQNNYVLNGALSQTLSGNELLVSQPRIFFKYLLYC